LHFGGRSSSSWLRLSNHGGVPGGICRHRRHLWTRFLVQDFQRCAGLSTKATTLAKRASSQEGTSLALTGRSDSNAARPLSSNSEAATAQWLHPSRRIVALRRLEHGAPGEAR
jgi:hypothetical protein